MLNVTRHSYMIFIRSWKHWSWTNTIINTYLTITMQLIETKERVTGLNVSAVPNVFVFRSCWWGFQDSKILKQRKNTRSSLLTFLSSSSVSVKDCLQFSVNVVMDDFMRCKLGEHVNEEFKLSVSSSLSIYRRSKEKEQIQKRYKFSQTIDS